MAKWAFAGWNRQGAARVTPVSGGSDKGCMMQAAKGAPHPEQLDAYLVEPLDLLLLVLALPGERAQLVLQVLHLLAQLLGLSSQLLLVRLQGHESGKQGAPPSPHHQHCCLPCLAILYHLCEVTRGCTETQSSRLLHRKPWPLRRSGLAHSPREGPSKGHEPQI